MLKLLGFMPGEGKNKKPDPNARVVPITDVEDEDIPRYPPFAKGLPATDKHKVLATQGELIERIRGALGFSQAEFNKLLLPVLERYASFVHLLPASEAHHHRGAGGLFRHGLEAAFAAAQASEGVMFATDGTPKERRDNEPRWRLASVIAALLHDVGKPLSDMSITNKEGTLIWNPYSDFLLDWAQKNKVERYFLRWRDNRHKRHEKFSLLAMDRIIPEKTRDFIAQPGPQIMESLLEAVSGTSINNPVTKLMMFADKESVARDLKRSRLNVDEFAYGVPVERYVFDAIRRLVSSGRWKVNVKGAKVWYLEEGVFITWRNIDELYQQIGKDDIPGIPRDPDTLADILIERGHAIENVVMEGGQEATYRYWQVTPDELGIPILMLRFKSHELVFTSEPPPPAKGVIGNPQQQQSTGETNSEESNKTGASSYVTTTDVTTTDGTESQQGQQQTDSVVDASTTQQIQEQANAALGQVGSFDFAANFGVTEQNPQQDTGQADGDESQAATSNVTTEQITQSATGEQSASETNNDGATQEQPQAEPVTPAPAKATGFRGMFVVQDEDAPPASASPTATVVKPKKPVKKTKPQAEQAEANTPAPVQPAQTQESVAEQRPAPAKPIEPTQAAQSKAVPSGNPFLRTHPDGKRSMGTGLGGLAGLNSGAGTAESHGLKFAGSTTSDSSTDSSETKGSFLTNRLTRSKVGANKSTAISQNRTLARSPEAKAVTKQETGQVEPDSKSSEIKSEQVQGSNNEQVIDTGFMPQAESKEQGASDESGADIYEFSTALSETELLETFKRMLVEGRGRWLTGAVTEKDGVYSTDRAAFHKIAAEQPSYSMTQISTIIRGNPQFKLHSRQIFFDPNAQRGNK